MPVILSTAVRFPPNHYSQEELIRAAQAVWAPDSSRVARFFESVEVRGRHLALPLSAYGELSGFGSANAAWVEIAGGLSEAAIRAALDRASMNPPDVAQLTSTTVTGIAVPSLDARLMNRIPFRTDLKRVPLFGLGCVGGAAGLARVADYLRAYRNEAAVLLAVELCSLTFRRNDASTASIVATALFGDGAAAAVVVGDEHPLASRGRPKIVATRSVFYPDSERVMGWDIDDEGFKVVLSADVPRFAREMLRPNVEDFLAAHELRIPDIDFWIAHPGGPRVIEAMEESLELPRDALRRTRDSLARVGNLSSVSVLSVLDDTLAEERPSKGTRGLLLAMGPGFCAELLLLRW